MGSTVMNENAENDLWWPISGIFAVSGDATFTSVAAIIGVKKTTINVRYMW